jgi:glyoxylase-like metal-dependent hydrolase (beta-lactamase superfamily II)
MTDGATGKSEISVPDTLIEGQTQLMPGGVQVSLFLSGNSHSPGDVLMWLPEQEVLVSGDVVYSDRMPSTFESDLSRWIGMLGEIIAMQPKVVIPGHGNVTDLDGVLRLRDLLQAFWAAVEHAYDAGKADYEMVPDVTAALAEYAAYYPGLTEKVKRDISSVYLQVEAASFR